MVIVAILKKSWSLTVLIEPTKSTFTWPVRVYYEDTDAGGVVYYANYLKFFERARSEWLNHLGIDQSNLLKNNLAFAVKRAEVDYHKPARLNDQLEVVSQIIEIGSASLTFKQGIFFPHDHQKALSEALVKVVCLKLDSFSPCRLPAIVKEELQRVC